MDWSRNLRSFVIAVSSCLTSIGCGEESQSPSVPSPGTNATIDVPAIEDFATIPLGKYVWDVDRIVVDEDGRYLIPVRSEHLATYVTPLIDTRSGSTISRISIDATVVSPTPAAIVGDPCLVISTEITPDWKTRVVGLDCASGRTVKRYDPPKLENLMAVAAMGGKCGVVIAEPRGSIGSEFNDPVHRRYTVFDLDSGRVDKGLTDLFKERDHDVIVSARLGCKAYVFRRGAPEPVLMLRGAYAAAEMGHILELWEIDMKARTSLQVARFPGSPTIDSSLYVKQAMFSKSGRFFGIYSERFEARYDPNGALRIGEYHRVELVDLQDRKLLTPFRCPYSTGEAYGGFLVGDQYVALLGCNGHPAGKIGSPEGTNILIGGLRDDDRITEVASIPSADLLAVVVRVDRGDELRLYRASNQKMP